MTSAWLYDGASALRHEVRIRAEESTLVIIYADGDEDRVARDRLVHIASREGAEIFGLRDLPGWRLGVMGGEETIAALLPTEERYGRWIDRVGLVPAIFAGLFLSALVILGGNRLPVLLAPLVPPSWEERFGNALVGDFGGRFCEGPGGQAALDRMVRRLTPRRDLHVRVVYIPIVNAAALPGGNIVLFDELLKEAENPEEVAGVLAHEIAHVEERHTTQAMIRELGLRTIIVAFGGTTGANVETLLSARYSRDAEGEADDGAIRSLQRAGISPLPTAGFFRRLAKREARFGRAGRGLAYLSTHPMSADRERKFRNSAASGHAYQPLLGRDDWDALVDICHNDPKRDEKRIIPRF